MNRHSLNCDRGHAPVAPVAPLPLPLDDHPSYDTMTIPPTTSRNENVSNLDRDRHRDRHRYRHVWEQGEVLAI